VEQKIKIGIPNIEAQRKTKTRRGVEEKDEEESFRGERMKMQ